MAAENHSIGFFRTFLGDCLLSWLNNWIIYNGCWKSFYRFYQKLFRGLFAFVIKCTQLNTTHSNVCLQNHEVETNAFCFGLIIHIISNFDLPLKSLFLCGRMFFGLGSKMVLNEAFQSFVSVILKVTQFIQRFSSSW